MQPGRVDLASLVYQIIPRFAKQSIHGVLIWERLKGGEDEMVGWHHWLNEHEFEQSPRVGDGQGSLACCSPGGHKVSDTTEQLNWIDGLSKHECGSSGEETHKGQASSHSLLQGIFLTQASNFGLLHCRRILYCLSQKGSPSMIHTLKGYREPLNCGKWTHTAQGDCQLCWDAGLPLSEFLISWGSPQNTFVHEISPNLKLYVNSTKHIYKLEPAHRTPISDLNPTPQCLFWGYRARPPAQF